MTLCLPVLNAFRHQRFDTNVIDKFNFNSIKVLNAFRHQRFDTRALLKLVLMAISAQRLSASEIRHSFSFDGIFWFNVCSTPFGIRDSTPPKTFPSFPYVAKCSTPFGIRDSTLQIVIQTMFFNLCSTPFGIRDSTHNQKEYFCLAENLVLNAFRHQRFDTATAKTLIEFITEANLASTS